MVIDGKIEGLNGVTNSLSAVIPKKLADPTSSIFAMPVGNYFKGGLVPTNFLIQDEYDRAAPNGTGAAKVGGNYAASLLPGKLAKSRHF